MSEQSRLRARLARCALDLFDRKGFAATTVDEIAAAAGVSRRTFFRHFPRKEAVILFEQELIQAGWSSRLAKRAPGVSTLDLFVEGARMVIIRADSDPVRRSLRAKLVATIPELASIERDADAQIVKTFVDAYAAELGDRPEDRIRATAVGAAIVAAINAALAECTAEESAIDLFDIAASCITNWMPAAAAKSVVAVLRVPSSLSDDEIIARLGPVDAPSPA